MAAPERPRTAHEIGHANLVAAREFSRAAGLRELAPLSEFEIEAISGFPARPNPWMAP